MRATWLGRKFVVADLLIICLALARNGLADTGFLVKTITNPAPTNGNRFGFAVAPFGTDRMLIGAPSQDVSPFYPGTVSLFSANAELLTVITNPSASIESFGAAVTGVGTDWVVVGDPYSDMGGPSTVYIFNTNGTLLKTITYPDPPPLYFNFGISLAPFGTNAFLVGAWDPDYNSGSVYLLDTSGNFLTSFTNPVPGANGMFGASVAAVGMDRVLIGAAKNMVNGVQSGAAYLYRTNGAVLTTFLDPTPEDHDWFGNCVAALGTDRVVITAPHPYIDTAGGHTGAAFIFSTNGTLLRTITNPAPATSSLFGEALAVSADGRLLIGTYGGPVYVYSSNGTLLATLGEAAADGSSWSAAWVGPNLALVGDNKSNIGGIDNGVAYLFSIVPEPPSLRIRLTSTNTVAVYWPSLSPGWTLQQNTKGIQTLNWSNITTGILDDGTTRTLVESPRPGSRFFRLVSP